MYRMHPCNGCCGKDCKEEPQGQRGSCERVQELPAKEVCKGLLQTEGLEDQKK